MASDDLEAQRPLLSGRDADGGKPEDERTDDDKRGIVATVFTMLLSIPALGKCCVTFSVTTLRPIPYIRVLSSWRYKYGMTVPTDKLFCGCSGIVLLALAPCR